MAKRKSSDFDPMSVVDGKMAAAGETPTATDDRDDEAEEQTGANVAAGQLRSLIERIENRMEEKAVVADEIKQIFGEAKGLGYDNKAIRRIIAIRAMDRNEYLEEESILDSYLAALGML